MILLPQENITFKSRLSEDEIVKRLSDITQRKFLDGFAISDIDRSKQYIGIVNDNEFKICRIIIGYNSFLPEICGTIHNNFDGIIIKVKMSLHIFTKAFLAISVIFALLFAFIDIDLYVNNKSESLTFSSFLLPFIYALTMICFKVESIKSKKDFRKLFEAEII